MKTTARIFGADPFQEAVSVTQHIWPAALPKDAPGENDNDPDRPWALHSATFGESVLGDDWPCQLLFAQ